VDRGSNLFRAVVLSAISALISASLSGCAYLQQPRQWGTCALVGGIVGAGAGTGIGTAINENTGDHESGVAFGLAVPPSGPAWVHLLATTYAIRS